MRISSKLAFLLFLTLAAALSVAQTQPPPVTTSQLILPLSTNLTPVSSAAVTVVGNPGPATYYYWFVANYLVGSTSPVGPFILQNAPNTLSVSNYNQIVPVFPTGATVDVLRTISPTPPIGACNCAVAVGVVSGPINDQSSSLLSYTITPFVGTQFTLAIDNEVVGAGSTHAILRQNGAFVSDLSLGGGVGTITGSGTPGTIPLWTGATVLGNSGFTSSGGTTTLAGNLDVTGVVSANTYVGTGAILLSSSIPGVNFTPQAGLSELALQSDGNFYVSNDGGAFNELATTASVPLPAGSADALQWNNGSGGFGALNSPTTNGTYAVIYNVTGSAAVSPAAALGGINVDSQTGNYTLACPGDRLGELDFNLSAAATLTLPQAGSTACLGSNMAFVVRNAGVSTAVLTVSATTSTFQPENVSSHTVLPGGGLLVYSDANSSTGNYHALDVPASFGGINKQTTSYTANAGDRNKFIQMACTAACALTLPATPPNSAWAIWALTTGTTNATINLNSLTYNGGASAPVPIQYLPLQIRTDGTNYFGDTPPVAGTGISLTPAANGLTIANSNPSPYGNASLGVDSGTATAFVVTGGPVTALTTGATGCFLPTHANSGAAPTVAFNGLTATAIVKQNANALVANDMLTTQVACVTYNGTNFILLDPQATTGVGSAVYSGGPTLTGNVNFSNTINKYQNVTTAGGGVLAEYFNVLSTGLTANYNAGAAKTLITPAAANMFLVCYYESITTAATTSSTAPSLTLGYTDAGGIARTLTLFSTSTANTTGTVVGQGCTPVYANTTAITATSASYASSGATSMAFDIGITVVAF